VYCLTSEKQNRLYGQIIKAFANSKSTDEACAVLIKGIQQAFSFSSNFLEQSNKILPSLKKFESNFSKQEKVLLKLILAELDIIDFLNSQFVFQNRTLIGYNADKNTLIFQNSFCNTSTQSGHVDRNVILKKQYTMHIREIEPHEWEMMKPRTFNEAERLMKVGSVKSRFRQNVSKERYAEIKSQAKTYQSILAVHEEINQFQNGIKKTLDEIVKRKQLYENECFRGFLSFYKIHCNLKVDLLYDDTFRYISNFMKEDYYLKEHKTTIHSGIFAYFHTSIPFFLVEFFKQPKNKKLIHICDECGKYFISKRDDSRIRFCPSCSPKSKKSKELHNEYMKKYRQKKKQEKLSIQREARIKNLVNTGWTRKEAEEMIEADSMM